MPENIKAIELIRRFYKIVADRDHKQLVQQLLGLVVRLPEVLRVVLVIAESGQLRVRGIANSDSELLVINSELGRLRKLPKKFIQQAYDKRELSFRQLPRTDIDADCYHTQANTLVAMPVVEDGQCQGLLYVESEQSPKQLVKVYENFRPVLAFQGLLLRHLNMVWQHEAQLEKIRLAEKALWASEAYLNSILEYSPLLISIIDLHGNIVLASHHYKHYREGKQDSQIEAITAALWQDGQPPANHAEHSESELAITAADGSEKTYLITRFPLLNQHQNIFSLCAVCTDISARKQAELEMQTQQLRLNYMAFHDSLTGLPNRALFQERAEHSLAHAQRDNSKVAVMLLDLDRFKYINDSFGHDAGDALLKGLSERLVGSVRDADTVARLGGDEFVVVLEGIHGGVDIRRVAEKLLLATACPISLRGHEITCTVSIGVSVFPQDGETVEELLKHADVAMYKAKEAGKNNFKLYNFDMNAKAVDALLLENELRRAINKNELSLAYQPKINLKNGEVVGVEALVRWCHPQRGPISPVEFIPLAEETGLIVPLGEWVLRSACLQQKAWRDAEIYVGSMAVNLSPLQLRQKKFPYFLAKLLREIGLHSSYLELELTETSAMENAEETIGLLQRLSDMGIGLSVDDFGTGYSSLAYLKRLPVNTLKIDRSFTDDITVDPSDAVIAKSIIDLGHNMGLKVVAEGVETELQETWLRQQGCDQAQGFYYSRPMAADDLVQALADLQLRAREAQQAVTFAI